jgi:hypothetical protein
MASKLSPLDIFCVAGNSTEYMHIFHTFHITQPTQYPSRAALRCKEPSHLVRLQICVPISLVILISMELIKATMTPGPMEVLGVPLAPIYSQ